MSESSLHNTANAPAEPAEAAGLDAQTWREHLLSEGPEYWQLSADRETFLAQRYAEQTYLQPGHPDESEWAKLATAYGDSAIMSRELAEEAAAKYADTTE